MTSFWAGIGLNPLKISNINIPKAKISVLKFKPDLFKISGAINPGVPPTILLLPNWPKPKSANFGIGNR